MSRQATGRFPRQRELRDNGGILRRTKPSRVTSPAHSEHYKGAVWVILKLHAMMKREGQLQHNLGRLLFVCLPAAEMPSKWLVSSNGLHVSRANLNCCGPVNNVGYRGPTTTRTALSMESIESTRWTLYSSVSDQYTPPKKVTQGNSYRLAFELPSCTRASDCSQACI
jgi:hypothetical protein